MNSKIWHLFRLLMLLGFVLYVSSPRCLAQEAADRIVKKLTGSKGREWTFKKWEMFMGPGNRCTQGASYRFTADHQVKISSCVDGHVKTETKPWSLDAGSPLDTKLTIGDSSYVLLFWDKEQGHFMTLRTKPADKTKETVDMEFQLQED
jgi:hypothetical protein